MMRWCVGGILLTSFSVTALPAEEPAPTVDERFERLNQRIEELEAQVGVEEFVADKEGEGGQDTEVPKVYDEGKQRVAVTVSEITKEELKLIYDGGYYFVGKNDTLQIGGFAQTDFRKYFDNHPGVDQFVIRRARVDIRGSLDEVWAYRLYFSFGGTAGGRLQHAWLEYKKWEWFRIRAGQYKEPFSLDALTSSAWLRFIERALGPTNLAPFEDIGVQFYGTVDCEKWIYAVGFFNGQGINKNDLNDSKDIAARVTYQPWRYACNSIFRGLYLGSAFTTGYNKFDLDGKKYYTGLRTAFQTFGTNVEQRGNLFRVGLEFDWTYGPYWLGGEYIYHRRRGVYDTSHHETVRSDAWYVGAACLLTGENQPRNGPVKPFHNFDPCSRGMWGAWGVSVRYDEFRTNDKPFSKGLISGTNRVKEYTAGVVWWPNDIHVKVKGNFIYSNFADAVVVSGHKLRDEKGVVFRAQYAF